MSKKLTPSQKLAAISRIYETRRKVKVQGHTLTESTHAYYNLEGAIIDITVSKGKCDRVCLKTLKRVAKQLAEIGKVLEDRA
ncbi:MAG TPA: hypothetical protein VKR31_00935 [Rhizomicrobium sp.]|nr:hypothetical protein [Rhizomicrobium sp.]